MAMFITCSIKDNKLNTHMLNLI